MEANAGCASNVSVTSALAACFMSCLWLNLRRCGRRIVSLMKIYIGQINPTVGALATNAELIRKAYADGVQAGADVVMVPELAVTGYPPRDLIDREVFVSAALAVGDALAAMMEHTA